MRRASGPAISDTPTEADEQVLERVGVGLRQVLRLAIAR
jgi:hypothetical protein